ncbi:Uncharacterised protein [Mycobacteroides abscessus subsp. abscessus]|nr:Uncharacterised protein [Mycobacteroides abscessus subsp. abscessus]
MSTVACNVEPSTANSETLIVWFSHVRQRSASLRVKPRASWSVLKTATL